MFCWRVSGQLDLASGRLHRKASPSTIFTFASRHPCKQVLSVVYVCWAVETGCEQELYAVHVHWAVRTSIKHWLSVTCVRTLVLAVRTVCSENRLCWAVKSPEYFFLQNLSFLVIFCADLALFSPFHSEINLLEIRCPLYGSVFVNRMQPIKIN